MSIKEFKVRTFQNARFEEDNIVNLKFQHCQFIDFSGHNKQITNCDFSYTFFNRVYFNDVVFNGCNFTGAKFFDSNIRDATFINCKFHYAIFKFTLLKTDNILANLPEWPNAKTFLLQNLKANANSFGDTRSARKFLLSEIDSTKEHLYRARKKSETYYAHKYSGLGPTIEVYWKSFWLLVDKLAWGYGTAPWRIVLNVLIVFIVLAFIQTISAFNSVQDIASNYWLYLKENIKAFLGMDANNIDGEYIAVLILVRYLTLGLFIRILFNRYSWR